MARILIIDDEQNMRRILTLILQEAGHTVSEASGVTSALSKLATEAFDLVISDKKMPDGDGFDVLRFCRENEPSLPVVILTALATVELAVEAMQAGAFDFISKPFVPEVVTAVAKRATERTQLLRENEVLREEAKRFAFADEILGVSLAITHLKETIAKVAPTNATVLITGETGTGKELVARAIHKGSSRSQTTFLAVNCAAVSEHLLESELFGHEKGSFTGADKPRQGLFEAANHGTLFLDEAGEMSLGLQAKLLRVLTDGQFLRVGATVPRTVDVRVIVATHRNLHERVKEGLFREDLYYRLAVVPIEIPPLRNRRDDIPVLVDFLIKQVSRELKVSPRIVSPEAIAKLMSYSFPGNVRELRNLVERACILASGNVISSEDLVLASNGGSNEPITRTAETLPPNTDLPTFLDSIESRLIKHALSDSGGVQAEAARRLGISRSDIAYKIKKHHLQ
ncbi:MAG TPA: sigma-54 dependent transcriptional regulator [Pyrinomonadaceae bacterium]|nr:sigma-54-dependent Fis family transcriptional regulator [Acidobacteriota bacterium]HQZ94758.1 sigma-54 dependent transcriptional regulator [Pyrinomonadaceae bacterium]